MILYHFTFVAHLFPILGWRCLDDEAPPIAEGIRPTVNKVTGPMTGGVPVVWLTSLPSLMPTPADLGWTNSPSCTLAREEIAEWRERGAFGDRTAMLVVDLSDKRLRHYGRWVRKHLVIDPAKLPPSALTKWWVYFGTINPNRVKNFSWTDAPGNEAEERLKAAIDTGRARAAG
jgi:hypothetical protein